MLQKLKGVHVGFLHQMMGKKDRRLGGKTWQQEGADKEIHMAGTKPLREYINKRQATVAERVDLRPIFKVCVKEAGYEGGGGGGFREPWWQHADA